MPLVSFFGNQCYQRNCAKQMNSLKLQSIETSLNDNLPLGLDQSLGE